MVPISRRHPLDVEVDTYHNHTQWHGKLAVLEVVYTPGAVEPARFVLSGLWPAELGGVHDVHCASILAEYT